MIQRAAHSPAFWKLLWLIVLLTPRLAEADPDGRVELKLPIPGVASVFVERISSDAEPAFRYWVETSEGSRSLTPEAFAQLTYDRHRARPFWKIFLNVTSPIGIAWVGFGLMGQLLFTGRMLVQWLTSEKHKRSIVPIAFWWMSLGGASMLLVYFIWRKDVIGIIGQSTGWFIYARNLHLIYAGSGATVSD